MPIQPQGQAATSGTAPRTILHAARALDELLDRPTRRRFVVCIVASVGIALIEIAGLVIIIPLLTILSSGELPDAGISGEIVAWTGSTDPDTVVLILTAAAFACFVARALATLAVRWWIFGRIFEDEAATSARLMRRFLSAPFMFHLRTNSTQLLRTLTLSVDQTYSKVIVSLLTIATELIVALATVVLLAVTEPVAAAALFVYFAIAYAVITRVMSARSRRVGMRFQQHNADVLKEAAQAFGAIKHIQLGAHEDHFVARLEEIRQQTSDTKRKLQFLAEVPRQYFELAFVIGIGLMIVAVAALQGASSIVAAIGLFAVAGFRLLPGLVRISNSSQALQSGLPALTAGARCAAAPSGPTRPRDGRPSDGLPQPAAAARRLVPLPGLRDRRVAGGRPAPRARRLGGHRGTVGLRQEHPHRHRHGAPPAGSRRALGRRLVDGRHPHGMAALHRPRPAGHLPARRDDRREHRLRAGAGGRSTSGGSPRPSRWRNSPTSSPSYRPACRPSSASVACGSPAASASAWASPGRCTSGRDSSCSTRPRRRWTR